MAGSESRTKNLMGYVYLIGSAQHRWYKIGISSTPNIRIRNIGVLLPFKVEIWAIWKTKSPRLLEIALHEYYAERRINGEWFSFKPEKVREIIATAAPPEWRIFPSDKSDCDLAKVKGVELATVLTVSDVENRRLRGIENDIMRRIERGKPLTKFQQEHYDALMAHVEKSSCPSVTKGV